MMFRRFVIWIATIGSTMVALMAGAQDYRYVRWVGLDRVTVKEPVDHGSVGQIVVGNDAFFETKFCGEESSYHCFFSAHHAFAVPKSLGANPRSEWTVEGVTFELVATGQSAAILGRRVNDLFVIRSPADATAAGGKPWLYLYSARDGVVAFGSEDLRATYWLEGEVGFGDSRPRASAEHRKE
jgi:hypothetical protein